VSAPRACDLCWQPVDTGDYRAEAETFLSDLDREYYLHFSGRKDDFEIEAIYARHAGLFSRGAVDALRDAGNRELLRFAAEGHVEQAVKEQSAELARLEAALEVEVDGRSYPLREAAVVQANEREPERRRALEEARNEVVATRLQPLLREAFERSRATVRELGWPSVRAMTEELSGIDLAALGTQTDAFLAATESSYEAIVEPRLREELGVGFDALERADLPAFFRSPSLDELFPADRLLPTFDATVTGLGLDAGSPGNVILDAEPRPKKSPRAFCAPVRVPEEVYLVLTRIGGREDYETLLHEAGHAEHYSHVDPALPFEHRFLGDNSVTEGFAFLFQHLTEDPAWLERRLGVDDPTAVVQQARAGKLVFLRRYCAKLAYELELQGGAELDGLDEVYARRLSEAVHVDWPSAQWLSDVDAFFYVASYLRAWALETHLRRELRERFGERWFEDPEAGALLRTLWTSGQQAPAHELLAELTGAELDFSALLDEFAT
jgi:hypothetical protein